MEPVSFLTGAVVGFVSGVSYGRRHSKPWQNLKDTAGEAGLWAQRNFMGGPKPPEPDTGSQPNQ